MCHRFGRGRDGVLVVKALGIIEARRDVSTSARFIPPWGESLGTASAVFFAGVVSFFCFAVLLVFLFGLRGPWVFPGPPPLKGTTEASPVPALIAAVAGSRIASDSVRGPRTAGPLPSLKEGAARAASADETLISMRLAIS
jgi:hypothetical protein